MRTHTRTCPGLMALGALAFLAGAVRSGPPDAEATPAQARRATERGLAFLRQDATKWRKERQCSTCHHGTMTVWALSEAKSQGYDVTAEELAEAVKWTRERLLNGLDL